MKAHTKLLRQYFEAKASHPGVLLAMRVGDFFEFYGDDAETAASALSITLTGREDGPNGRVAMAGVPHHAVERYVAALLKQGIRVALMDQVEDPKQAKGLVRREVTRVLSPGTVVEDSMLRPGANNFLAAICVNQDVAGLAMLDPSTGEFLATEIEGERSVERLLQEIARLAPAELLVPPESSEVAQAAQTGLNVAVTEDEPPHVERARTALTEHFAVKSLAGFGCEDRPRAQVAASMVLGYARRNGLEMSHVSTLGTYSVDDFMRLDPATRDSLELTRNLTDGGRDATLLEVIDQTVSPMGARTLRRWLDQPLLEPNEILARHQAIHRMVEDVIARGDLREAIKRVSDVERLVSRCCTGHATPRDLVALRDSLRALPDLDDPMRRVSVGRWQELRERMDRHDDLSALLDKAVVNEPPATLREGGVIREGFDVELDKLREMARDGKSYIAKLEAQERETTGIERLKVGYNSVFGYYLEVSKAHLAKVPEHYVRKQTTANAERYITAELKDHESAVLGAEERATELEGELFVRVRTQIADKAQPLLQTARAIAEADCLAALAETAVRDAYVQPELTDDDVLEIEAGRHPVVEARSARFVPNDVALDRNRTIVLTGPNMSGKSTYLRQIALIVLLAQIGSFVPAKRCRLGLCDRIFTRIGARDELARGHSTFMVEMLESANILNNATDRSLVILDEVGRGTSTYDGLAIAWAMVEHLIQVGAKTLFATHYHQLNRLVEDHSTVANFRVDVEERGDDVVWTHKVVEGGADRSYGVQVARMAGVPKSVLQRATEVLADLERSKEEPGAFRPAPSGVQMRLFDVEEPEWVKDLQGLDVNAMTPIQALQKLEELKRQI